MSYESQEHDQEIKEEIRKKKELRCRSCDDGYDEYLFKNIIN